MAMTYNAQKAPFGAITTFRITSALSSVVDDILAWNARRAMAAKFSALTPRELEDIGLLAAAREDDRPGVFARIAAWAQDKVDNARTAHQLSSLSPEMLEDIGMTTADVDAFRNRTWLL